MPIATAMGNAALRIPAAIGLPASMAPRAATHRSAIAMSHPPVGVGWFVQFRTAVKRKPATTANAKPKSISCPCRDGASR